MTDIINIDALVSASDDEVFGAIRDLRKEANRRNESALITLLKTEIAADSHLDGAKLITFEVDHWDNGWFYTEHGVMVVNAKGDEFAWDFEDGDDTIRGVLTNLSDDFGPLTGTSSLIVDIMAETVTGD